MDIFTYINDSLPTFLPANQNFFVFRREKGTFLPQFTKNFPLSQTFPVENTSKVLYNESTCYCARKGGGRRVETADERAARRLVVLPDFRRPRGRNHGGWARQPRTARGLRPLPHPDRHHPLLPQ